MNYADKNIIELFCKYLNNDDTDALRQCSKYLSLLIGRIYFLNKTISTKKINEYSKHKFRYFVHKYNLTININNISNISELSYFKSYNIKTIYFGYFFNEKYSEYFIPSTLQKLRFNRNFNQSVKLKKIALKSLKFGHSFNQLLTKNTLPTTLIKLTLGTSHGCSIYAGAFNNVIKKNVLPISLKKLVLGSNFNQSIDNLPMQLEKLIFNMDFNQPINKLPPNLKILKLGCWFNQPINSLPLNLKKLELGYDFDQPIRSLPITLECLVLGNNFTHSLKHIQSSNLKFLTLRYSYKKILKYKYLPATLEKLFFYNWKTCECDYKLIDTYKKIKIYQNNLFEFDYIKKIEK